jgi:ribosomal-protein-alanine N-acetyltransferase
VIIPAFTTSRLVLKEITLDHAPMYQKYFNDYEIIGHLAPHVPWPYPDNGASEFIRNIVIPRLGNNFWMWGIFLKTNSDEIIGAIDLYRGGSIDNRGFWLARQYWGQGIMNEALKPITDYAFHNLGFEVLKLSNALGNVKSRRLKEKQGAKLIGTRKAKFINPDYQEAEDWELTKKDWFHRS